MKYFKYGFLSLSVIAAFLIGRTTTLNESYETDATAEYRYPLVSEDTSSNKPTNINKEIDTAPIALLSDADKLLIRIKGDGSPQSRVDAAVKGERIIMNKSPAITEAEIAVYDQHHIISYNRIIDTVCTDVAPTGGALSSVECIYTFEREKHPYFNLEPEELLDLAGSDAVAALALSKKLKEPDARLSWALAATALSSKTGPLLEIANSDYPHTIVSYDAKVLDNNSTIIMRLALENVLHRLKDPRSNLKFWENRIAELSPENFVNEIERSRKIANEMLQQLLSAQSAIGRTDIKKVLDNV